MLLCSTLLLCSLFIPEILCLFRSGNASEIFEVEGNRWEYFPNAQWLGSYQYQLLHIRQQNLTGKISFILPLHEKYRFPFTRKSAVILPSRFLHGFRKRSVVIFTRICMVKCSDFAQYFTEMYCHFYTVYKELRA